jgi:hypothetical protein
MPIVSVPLAGQYGLSLDIAPAELPANAWSRGYNIRFYDGALGSMNGDMDVASMPTAQPTYALPVKGAADVSAGWLVMADDKAFCLDGTVLTEVTPVAATPGGYPAGSLVWSGGNLGLLTVMNDGVRPPWYWPEPLPSTPMEDLPNWPTDMTCACLRSYKQTLVALDITKDNVHFPTMVKWSHPADPGTVPISWDETDETKDAGETVLAETPGACVDAVGLRDSLVIYKTDSVWGMNYIGGVFIYRFTKLFGEWGIPNRNCAVEYTAGKHFCFTGTDLMIHDGNTAQSVVKGKVKSLLRQITVDQLKTCFVCSNPAFSEAWFCYRRQLDGKQAADTAIVFNTLEGTISIRLLPDFRFIGTGRVDPTAQAVQTWDPQTVTWDTQGSVWSESAQIPAFLRLLALGTNKVLWADGMDTMLGPALVERQYVGVPIRTNTPPDFSAMKFIRRIWPRFVGATGTKLKVTFGHADGVGEPVTWRDPLEFVIGTTRKFDITLSGKVMAMRIEADTVGQPVNPRLIIEEELEPSPHADEGSPTSKWRFTGMDVDLTAAGEM